MGIYDIETLINTRMRELDREMGTVKRQLKLQDVLSEVYFYPEGHVGKPFQIGQDIELPLKRGECIVVINNLKIVLYGPHKLQIETWYSEPSSDYAVQKFYDKMTQAIIDAQNPGGLPF